MRREQRIPQQREEFNEKARERKRLRREQRTPQQRVEDKKKEIKRSAARRSIPFLLDDEEIAALASYLRSAWGNTGGEVTADQVAEQR